MLVGRVTKDTNQFSSLIRYGSNSVLRYLCNAVIFSSAKINKDLHVHVILLIYCWKTVSISLAINRPTSALSTVDKSTNFVIYFVKYFGFTYNFMYLLGYISISKGICIFSCNFLSSVLTQRHWNNQHSDKRINQL